MIDKLIKKQDVIKIFSQLWDCIDEIADKDEWEDVCKTTANELPPASYWIPCSERLPKRMTDDNHFIIWNLVCCLGTDIGLGYFDPDSKTWCVTYPAEADDIVAWMPLPKPYNKENQKIKIEFTKDFAKNWKAGEIVEVKDLGTGEVLIDNVAKVDAKLLFEHCKIISKKENNNE